LAAQLIEHDLVDGYRLMIEPILLSAGKRIFPMAARPERSGWFRRLRPGSAC
jgi:dihydrofolate reductase